MAPPLLSLNEIGLGFGGKPLLEKIDLSILAGQKFCLIGRNGCGKSTLLKIMAQRLEIDHGKIYIQPGATIGYLDQDVILQGEGTLQQWVLQCLPKDQQNNHYRADIILESLGLDPMRFLGGLSGGECRRAALARVFVQETDILLLDEPTNHLDLPTIEWLENYLNRFKGALCIISHDRRFLMNVSNSIGWVDRGHIKILNKSFSHFEEWSEQILHDEEQQLQQLNKQLVTETQWLRQGVAGRRKRNQGRLRRLQELRERRRGYVQANSSVKGVSMVVEDSSQMMIEAEHIGKFYYDHNGKERWIIKDFSTRVLQGDRIGIIGANGAGKTTLLKMLIGDLLPDKGHIVQGKKKDVVVFDQHRELLNGQKTLWETLCPAGGEYVDVQGKPCHVIGYLRRFLFAESQAKSPVSLLSGGEKNRLLLAKILAAPSSVMVLDEPTNDLDMDTLDLLQDVLSDYTGTIIVISHDRDFLDQLVNSIVVVQKDGTVDEYAGGYQEYLNSKGSPQIQLGKRLKETAESQKLNSKNESSVKKIRLSYHQARLLEILPKEIEILNRQILIEEKKLDDPQLWEKDKSSFIQVTELLAAAQKERAEKEDQLLELMILQESIDNV